MENQKKVLRLSQKNKMVAGVCGGLAEYFNLQSAFLIRLLFVLGALFLGGATIPLYMFLMAIMSGKSSLKFKNMRHNNFFDFWQKKINNEHLEESKINDENQILTPINQKKIAYQAESIEINNRQNKSGIVFDLRSKLMIIAVIILLIFVLWKIGIIQFDFNMIFNKFETMGL